MGSPVFYGDIKESPPCTAKMAFLFDPLPPDKQPLFRWVVTIGTVHIQFLFSYTL
jgi:hypothetical protein